MAEIKTREKFKGIKALDKAAVAGERMKRAFGISGHMAWTPLGQAHRKPITFAVFWVDRALPPSTSTSSARTMAFGSS